MPPDGFNETLAPLRAWTARQLDAWGLDVSPDGVLLGVAVIVALLAFALVRELLQRLFRRIGPKEVRKGVAELKLTEVDEFGPPAAGPHVVCYHVPVRLAVVVFAPLGRGSILPAAAGVPNLVNEIVDRLGEAIEPHETQIKLWPPQLSSEGFASAFFGALKLPGKKGKGTPWNALAGRCEVRGQTLMIGMAFRADGPNNLGQMILAHEYNWREVVQVR